METKIIGDGSQLTRCEINFEPSSVFGLTILLITCIEATCSKGLAMGRSFKGKVQYDQIYSFLLLAENFYLMYAMKLKCCVDTTT